MIKIRTTFVGATDFRGEKIRVTGPCGQFTVAYDYGAYDMHDTAVYAYCGRFEIPSRLVPVGPDTHDNPRRRLSRSGRGYVYTLLPEPGVARIGY